MTTPTSEQEETFHIPELAKPVRLQVGDGKPVVIGWISGNEALPHLLNEVAEHMDIILEERNGSSE